MGDFMSDIVCSEDCFNCPYPDCILDDITDESVSGSTALDVAVLRERVEDARERRVGCRRPSLDYWKHREKRLAHAHEYYREHREERKAKALQRYHDNPEALIAYQRLRYHGKQDDLKDYQRRYYSEHSAERRAYQHSYYLAHRDEIIAYQMKRYWRLKQEPR